MLFIIFLGPLIPMLTFVGNSFITKFSLRLLLVRDISIKFSSIGFSPPAIYNHRIIARNKDSNLISIFFKNQFLDSFIFSHPLSAKNQIQKLSLVGISVITSSSIPEAP